MRQWRRFFFILSITAIVLSGCAAPEKAGEDIVAVGQDTTLTEAVGALDRLGDLIPLLGIKQIERIAEFSCLGQESSDVHIWNGGSQGDFDVCEPGIKNDQALLFDFMYKKEIDPDNDAPQIIFSDFSDGLELDPTRELGIQLGDQFLFAVVAGENYEVYEFGKEFDWQAEQVYTALVHMNETGCLDVKVWKKHMPESVIQAKTCQNEWAMDFPGSDQAMDLKFTVSVPADQAVKVSDLWLLDMGVIAGSSSETDIVAEDGNDTDTEESSDSEDETGSDDVSGESDPDDAAVDSDGEEAEMSVIYQVLNEYAIMDTMPIEDLNCGLNEIDADGNITWDASTNLSKSSDVCAKSIYTGQILTFNFTLWEDMDRDNNRIVWMLTPRYDGQIDIFNNSLGVDLANYDIVEKKNGEYLGSNFFNEELTWDEGQEYTAAMVFMLDGSVIVKFWPHDDPGIVLTSVVSSEYWMGQFEGNDNLDHTDLQLGLWMNGEQRLTMSSIRFHEFQ